MAIEAETSNQQQNNDNKINIQFCQMEYVFNFILLMYSKHNGMSSTKTEQLGYVTVKMKVKNFDKIQCF